MPRWIVVAAGTANSNLDTVPASDEAEADTAAVVVGSDGGVVRARLDRDRDGLLVFFVGIILFRVAAAVYFLTDLLVAAAPVVMLAS